MQSGNQNRAFMTMALMNCIAFFEFPCEVQYK